MTDQPSKVVLISISDEHARSAMQAFRKGAIPAEAMARAIVYALQQPPEVSVSEMIVRLTTSPPAIPAPSRGPPHQSTSWQTTSLRVEHSSGNFIFASSVLMRRLCLLRAAIYDNPSADERRHRFLVRCNLQSTLARWAKCGDIGDVVDRPFHPTKLSLTTGNFPGPLASVLDVLAQIRRSIEGDPLADALNPACLHFTFLALSQPDYPSLDHLPDLTDVKQVFARHCHKQIFSLHDLRLVALPNALLIAVRRTL